MLRASSSAVRVVSPLLQRHAPNASRLACAQDMSSDTKQTKKASKTEKPASPSSSQAAAAEQPVVEKGDTYKSGESYFGFNPYSFYDIENDMVSKRCPQPSAEKMKEHCLDKLNPEEEEIPRKLLAEDYGDLEEYPGKVIPEKPERPVEPVMRRKYDLGEKAMNKESNYKARMPL